MPGGDDKRGHVCPPHAEKQNHTQHLNDALTDALRKWDPAEGTEVVIRFEATITPNPGGIRDYWVSLQAK